MSQLPRRQVADAILTYLLSAPGLQGVIKTSGRGMKHWKDLQAANLNPAMFLAAESSNPKSDWGTPACWHLGFQLYLYAFHHEVDGTAQAQLDDLIDAVDEALKIEPLSKRQTLWGNVFNCRIEKIETDGGLLGEQAVGWIHIEVRNH